MNFLLDYQKMYEFSYFTGYLNVWYVWGTCTFMMLLFMLIDHYKLKRFKSVRSWLFLTLAVSVLMLGISTPLVLAQKDINDMMVQQKWEYDVVRPYIDNLPVQVAEVVHVKLDVTKAFNRKTNVIVLFKEGDRIQTVTTSNFKLDLIDSEKPYVTYRYLDVALGKYKEGYYDVEIHLSRDYHFESIK